MSKSGLSRRNFINKCLFAGSAVLSLKTTLFADMENEDRIRFHWIGVAGFSISYKGKVILIDPYFSREKFGDIHPVSWEYMKKYIPKADYIVMSHSHGDHMVDTPTIARSTGAKVIGTETTANICRAFKVPENQLIVTNGHDKRTKTDCGEFTVHTLPCLHGLYGDGKVPLPGFYKSVPDPTPSNHYHFVEGGTVASLIEFDNGRKILHTGSANFIDKELIGTNPDVFLLAIPRWENTPDFFERAMRCAKPKLVIPHHYDNFWGHSLEEPMLIQPYVDLDEFKNEMERVAPDVKYRIVSLFEEVEIS